MNDLSKDAVTWLAVGEEAEGQRSTISAQILKVPKSHVYRILRSGEVRVNRRRSVLRLVAGDRCAPPIRTLRRPGDRARAPRGVVPGAVRGRR
jgi:23S rRNA pseudouridine955/2504/2580 synthase